MKIRCMNNENNKSLIEVGKVYECVWENQHYFKVILNGKEWVFLKERFEVVKDNGFEITLSSDKEEKVDHPNHYNKGKYEVIDVIEDWKLGFNLGNAIKYIARAEHKENVLEDLKKAEWYIRREIEKRGKK